MRVKEVRAARVRTVTKRFTAVQTGLQILPAPGDGRRWVITLLYVNLTAAGEIELKAGVDAAWVDYDSESGLVAADGSGIIAGAFGANGGFATGYDLEAPVNKEIRFTSTGTPGNHWLVVSAYIEG